MIEIFKNTPPKSEFVLMKRYKNVSFKQQYSIKIIEKGEKIKADCIGNIKEKVSSEKITITISYFKQNG